jgi:hypothetical protein
MLFHLLQYELIAGNDPFLKVHPGTGYYIDPAVAKANGIPAQFPQLAVRTIFPAEVAEPGIQKGLTIRRAKTEGEKKQTLGVGGGGKGLPEIAVTRPDQTEEQTGTNRF